MEAPRSARDFSSLGPALRLLGLALLFAAAQSTRGIWIALSGIFRGGEAVLLPGVAEAICGLAVVAVGAFFVRHADENAQALAGGGRVLPPLTLLRLVQPRFEHPLKELWARSDPATPAAPMPESRRFAALWGAGLAIAIPLWAIALRAPIEGRIALTLDALHHAAIAAACLTALHFAAQLARRQDEAWWHLKPSVMPVPLRIVGRPKAPPAPAPGRPQPAAAQTKPQPDSPLSAPPPPPPDALPAPAYAARTLPPPLPEVAPAAAAPTACPICYARLAGRRCDACGSPALAAAFRVLSALGGSGARRTFLAEAPDGARVVLKELAIATAPDAQSLEAFSREARMLRELRHPKLPVYLDAFQEEEGPRARLYLAYRYLDGVSLEKELAERRYSEDEVLDLVEQVLEILRHLHGLQPPLIHRDLKPANLVRRRDGAIALIDFGVARSLDRTLNSGTVVGTIGYMPPEQLAGQVDLTCDLYALGATALHLITRTAPWEFMDGPELRLPPLKSAKVARALLKRMLAPRRAQRFSSAREALLALRRLRAGGLRPPRAAIVGAGVAALTALVALSATPKAKAPAKVAIETPMLTRVPSKPAPAPSTEAALASWRGGALTADQVKESLRKLPPWLKSDQPWWIQQHVLALVRRRLLAAEAQKRGLDAGLPLGADERLLAAALLEAEAQKDPDWVRARALRSAWSRTTNALLAVANLRFDDAQMFRIEPKRLLGVLPKATSEVHPPARFEIMAASGRCFVEVEPALRRYGGRCEGAETLAGALLDPETLQLVELAAPGFITRFTDDFVEAKALVRGEGLEAAQLAERALEGAEMRVAEVSGTVPFSQALELLAAVEPALRRCLAVSLQESPARALRARARIRVELQDGAVTSAKIETEPRLPAAGCAQALARPELPGTGAILVVADLSRAAGQPGRDAPPPPRPLRAEPARHLSAPED
jgi:serine/threonine protein kinase